MVWMEEARNAWCTACPFEQVIRTSPYAKLQNYLLCSCDIVTERARVNANSEQESGFNWLLIALDCAWASPEQYNRHVT